MEGITFETECIGKVYAPDEFDRNEWTLMGEPETTIVVNIPASTKSAVVKELTTPLAFRKAQGYSTKPATLSHTNPIIFVKAIDAASKHCFGVPPFKAIIAAEVITTTAPWFSALCISA